MSQHGFGRPRQRGSVIINAVLLVALAGLITYGLVIRAMSGQSLNRHINSERSAGIFERAVQQSILASLPQAVVTNDPTTAIDNASQALAGVQFEEWETSQTTLSVGQSFDDLFSKTANQRQQAGLNPLSGVGGFIYSRTLTTIGIAKLSRTGSDAATRAVPFSINLLEVPSSQFSLIAAEFPLDMSNSTTAITLDGRALLNYGVSGNIPTTANAKIIGRFLGGLSADAPLGLWGGSLMALATDTGNAAPPQTPAMRQNYPNSVQQLARFTVLDWEDPAGLPLQSMPNGVTVQAINGQRRVVVNLTYWFQDQGIYIRCGPATTDAGVVIVGQTTGGNTAPAIIATNGRLTVWGSNNRPVLLASSHSDSPTILSSASDGTTPGTAADTDWYGFWVVPKKGISFYTTEDWAAANYTLHGGLAFSGGSISGLPRITLSTLQTDAYKALTLLYSDRVAFPAVLISP